MLFLWFAGREVESIYGTRDFALMYITAAVISTLAWASLDYLGPSGGAGYMLGASGAVTAVLVIFAMYYPRREVLLFFILPVQIWLLLVIFVAWDFIQLMQELRGGASAGVDGVGGGFADNFKSALQSVSKAQNEANRLQHEVQMGNPNVSLEETMLAMQKAQIGFQATMHVRNRMVQAYTDIMNMQV